MLEYLAQNFGYILVTGVLLLIVAAIILRMVRNRRLWPRLRGLRPRRLLPPGGPPGAGQVRRRSRRPHRRRMTLCPIASPAI